jgi:hypothetical protein
VLTQGDPRGVEKRPFWSEKGSTDIRNIAQGCREEHWTCLLNASCASRCSHYMPGLWMSTCMAKPTPSSL